MIGEGADASIGATAGPEDDEDAGVGVEVTTESPGGGAGFAGVIGPTAGKVIGFFLGET